MNTLDPMTLLREKIPISLLSDLTAPEHVDSQDLLLSETADTDWLRPCQQRPREHPYRIRITPTGRFTWMCPCGTVSDRTFANPGAARQNADSYTCV